MSLSYSAITNHGKITLPSIDSWNTNMNILKDPPKALYTRRVNKVGQTSDITAMIDDSGDRECESILQYARGVNPSVSVSYNNTSKMSGNTSSNAQQAFLPYRIMRDGAFRAPIRTEYDLLPLSRQPRVWTSSYSNPAFPDYARKAIDQDLSQQGKEIRKQILETSARPTAVYKIELPQESQYDTKYKIQKSLNIDVSSGFKTLDITSQEVKKPTKEVNKNMNHTFAQSNINNSKNYINNNQFNPDRYLQDTNAHSVDTLKSANYVQIGSLDDYIDFSDVRVKDAMNVEYNTAMKGEEQVNYIHNDLFKERNLPYYTVDSNIKGNENVTYIHDDINLKRTMPNYSTTSNTSDNTQNKVTYIHSDVQLDRSIPYHSAISNTSGDKKINYIHEDIQLLRNTPNYNIDSSKKGNENVTYIHNDIALDRVLPKYTATTSKTQSNLQRTIKPEHVREMYNNIPTVKDVYINKGGNGESNISSRQFALPQKIQPGGYDNAGYTPNSNRANLIKENYVSDKTKMSKLVLDQQLGRFDSYTPFDKRFDT